MTGCYISKRNVIYPDGTSRFEYLLRKTISGRLADASCFRSELEALTYVSENPDLFLTYDHAIELPDRIVNGGDPVIMTTRYHLHSGSFVSYGLYVDDLNEPVKRFETEEEARVYAVAIGFDADRIRTVDSGETIIE